MSRIAGQALSPVLLVLAALAAPAAETRRFYTTADGLPSNDVLAIAAVPEVIALTSAGAARLDGTRWRAVKDARVPPPSPTAGPWTATREGVRNGARLFTAADGLPYNDFTCAAAAPAGAAWFGTHIGAFRFDGKTWEYRQGPRWLPGDDVRAIAVAPNGDAWLATNAGVAVIQRRPMPLAEKARFFEEEIDRRHRRTPYQYVLEVTLARPGDTSEWMQHDSDNDGLWTAMYGAGECFAYAATRDPRARERARQAFEALRFLGTVTQAGEHPAPRGFVARTILPASGPDPNLADSPARDERVRAARDRLWKVVVPRWPRNGGWYWKSDTSSDELDGHYFFYALYFDLVADLGEKQRVAAHVAALTDHLVAHGFQLVDHDGRVTRWGAFNPEKLNHDPNWRVERGLNSLSMLAYLKIAAHITGGGRYGDAARRLIRDHSYAMNVLIPKTNAGPGSGNQSDDEMAFMNYYHLVRYESDPELRSIYALALYRHWLMEAPEMNPLFNFVAAASATGWKFRDAFGEQDLTPRGEWLADALDTLRRIPLDRINWRHTNSHRIDLAALPEFTRDDGTAPRGHRRNGKVLPADERFFAHWNHDPWQLDSGGDGRTLADGAVFLLPYYMGRYHKFIQE